MKPFKLELEERMFDQIRDSIVVSIPACHAGDPGSIPGRGAFFAFPNYLFYYHYFLSIFKPWKLKCLKATLTTTSAKYANL